jgi:hypothetical protein
LFDPWYCQEVLPVIYGSRNGGILPVCGGTPRWKRKSKAMYSEKQAYIHDWKAGGEYALDGLDRSGIF